MKQTFINIENQKINCDKEEINGLVFLNLRNKKIIIHWWRSNFNFNKNFFTRYNFIVNNSNAEERYIKPINNCYHKNCYVNFQQYLKI